MSKIETISITPSSGNVFADMGVEDASDMLVKADLAHQIAIIIKSRRLTQTKAAEKLGMSQPKLSEMLRGKYRGISQAKMVTYLNLLGQDVEIVIRKVSNPRAVGQTTVRYEERTVAA
ncbi:MAG: helix-turn-helix transcriptional regulator [Duganella sp.]